MNIKAIEAGTIAKNQLDGVNPSWDVNSHSASLEIPHLLWNLKVHYYVYKSPSLVPVLSQMDPVQSFLPYFPNIHSVYLSIYLSVSVCLSVHKSTSLVPILSQMHAVHTFPLYFSKIQTDLPTK
jgi:hypothetical protein